jgi:RimJ/RimL family protein N-acetyltransferase
VAQTLVFDHMTLADGTAVTIRPIRPDDAPGLQAFHTRLSPETIYWRYLGAHPVLSAVEAERLAHVDCENRVAFVATHMENSQEDIIGVARYERLGTGHADEAEFAIVVEDRFQRRGIGTLLWRQLTMHACAHGVRLFVAVIHPENHRMLNLMRRSGLKMDTKLNGGVVTVRVCL